MKRTRKYDDLTLINDESSDVQSKKKTQVDTFIHLSFSETNIHLQITDFAVCESNFHVTNNIVDVHIHQNVLYESEEMYCNEKIESICKSEGEVANQLAKMRLSI